jgi:hypothetical protein
MVKKSAHPEHLFDYLNGAVDEAAARLIEAHISVCDDCGFVAAVCRALKKAASDPEGENRYQGTGEHPDISELASFFYARQRRADSAHVAEHVALCSSCAEEIAQYARAERVAYQYEPAKAASGEVPATAWEMIRDWEDSSFARLKPASEVLGQELLNRLFSLLDERTREIGKSGHEVSGSQDTGRVPVLVVSRSGKVRGVEFFETAVDSTGARVLKHAEGSQRFDNRLVHALLDYGESEPVLISEVIKSETVRLEHAPREEEELRRVAYFIIEN